MDALDEVIKADEAWRLARREAAYLFEKRNRAVQRARERGFKPGKIAEVLGVSPGRVTQIVEKRKE